MTLRCFQMLLARVCPTRQLAESFGKDKLAFPISFRYWVCTPVACDVSGDRPLIDAACCSVTNCDQLFATPWTIARQAPCPSPSPRLMSIESLMPSNHLILCHPLLLPSIFPCQCQPLFLLASIQVCLPDPGRVCPMHRATPSMAISLPEDFQLTPEKLLPTTGEGASLLIKCALKIKVQLI